MATASRAQSSYANGSCGIRPNPASRAKTLWLKLQHHLVQDWDGIRNMNLGVKSGTGVVDELLLRKIHGIIEELHSLAVTDNTAGDVVAAEAKKLRRDQLQQLQMLLDLLGHEYLSDYIRLVVYNVRDPFAKKAVDAITPKQLRSLSLKLKQDRARKKTEADHEHKMRLSDTRKINARKPDRDELLRFTGYLPEDHPLVQRAYRLYLARMPPTNDDGGSGIDDANAAESQRKYSAQQIKLKQLHDEWIATEEARKPPEPELPLWLDVERRWQETCHNPQKLELSNTIMVADRTPLYSSLPNFKKKLQEEQERQIQATPPSPSRRNQAGSLVTGRPPNIQTAAALLGNAGPALRASFSRSASTRGTVNATSSTGGGNDKASSGGYSRNDQAGQDALRSHRPSEISLANVENETPS